MWALSCGRLAFGVIFLVLVRAVPVLAAWGLVVFVAATVSLLWALSPPGGKIDPGARP